MYSPVGTVVFEALLVAENISNFFTIEGNFAGAQSEYGPYSINGMDNFQFDAPTSNPLLTITLDDSLDPNDDQVDYTFTLDYVAAGFTIRSQQIDVILHEIGKLLHS